MDAVPIFRTSWLNSILDVKCWSNECSPKDQYNYYFERVDKTVRRLKAETGKPVELVGHSARGWLARAIMGDGIWRGSHDNCNTSDLVAGLVTTLGTPHSPSPLGVPEGVREMLCNLKEMYPGAHLCKDHDSTFSFYVTVAGIASETTQDKPVVMSRSRGVSGIFHRATGNVFKSVAPRNSDGIVPVENAHLDGATQLTLDNIYHSIHFPDCDWYGASHVVDKWLPHTLQALSETMHTRHKHRRRQSSADGYASGSSSSYMAEEKEEDHAEERTADTSVTA